MKKLHSGELFWEDTIKNAEYLELNADINCDVVVIGGGISGALIGNALIREGLDVVVLDKRTPGYGSSDGNTGIIQYNSDMSLYEMVEEFGEKWAVDFYGFSILAMEELGNVVNYLGEDVGYKDTASLFLCNKEEDLEGMKNNFETLKKYDFPAEWIGKERLKSEYQLEACGAMKTWKDAELNPFKMVQELHRDSLKNAGRVFKNAEVKRVVDNEEGFIVIANDYFIESKFLVYATGYEENMVKIAEPYCERNTTFSLVTEKLDFHWGNKEMLWDSADPYVYFRFTEQNRIIAGGLDRSGTRLFGQNTIDKKSEEILEKIKMYYPNLNTKIYKAWQSIFGESKDGIPFIGKFPDNYKKFYALGFGGNGTCYSVMASLIIKDYILGSTHCYAYTTDLETRKNKEVKS